MFATETYQMKKNQLTLPLSRSRDKYTMTVIMNTDYTSLRSNRFQSSYCAKVIPIFFALVPTVSAMIIREFQLKD